MAQGMLDGLLVNALIVYLVVGLAVGLVAPLLAGRQAMGIVGTCLLGAIGAFIGGVLGSYDLADGQFMVVRLAGLIHAAVGAIVTLVLVIAARDRSRAQPFSPPSSKKKRDWNIGLLSSDHRSFDTISKQHQRIP